MLDPHYLHLHYSREIQKLKQGRRQGVCLGWGGAKVSLYCCVGAFFWGSKQNLWAQKAQKKRGEKINNNTPTKIENHRGPIIAPPPLVAPPLS